MKTRATALRGPAALLLALLAACSAPTPAPVQAPTVNPPLPLPPTAIPPTAVPPTPTPLSPEAILLKSIDGYAGPLADKEKFSGAILVSREGKILLNRGYGFADRASKKPIDAQTQFVIPLASAWPSMTALVLRLQDAKKLSLDDSVCKTMEACPAHLQAVTLRHLLSNAGGLPDRRFDRNVPRPEMPAGTMVTASAVLGVYRGLPRDKVAPVGTFGSAPAPGGAPVKADLGNWELAFGTVSQIAGKLAYLLLVEQAATLSLTSDGLSGAVNNSREATLTDQGPVMSTSPRYNGSGILSAQDLHTLIQALFDGRLLTAEQLKTMLTPQVKTGTLPGNMSYGLGVYVGEDTAGRRMVAQYDVAAGAGSFWAYYPDSKTTVIVMNNLTDWDNEPFRARDIGLEVAKRAFEIR